MKLKRSMKDNQMETFINKWKYLLPYEKRKLYAKRIKNT